MAKMGIFCASAGGTSKIVADELAKEFGIDADDVIDMEEDFDDIEQFEDYDVLFIGSSTWGQGDVHFSWVDVLLDMEEEELNLSGKKVAFFGAGDSVKHGEQFCSALGKLYKVFTSLGAKAIGFMPTYGYNYEFSAAQIDGKLCGLAIDEHNEKEKTQSRMGEWIQILKSEL